MNLALGMEVTIFVTIAIAFIGWGLAIIQMYKNRQWQKKDLLASRRYEAYNRFMVQMDSMSSNMKKYPQKMIGETLGKFILAIRKEGADIDEELIKFNTEVSKFLQSSIEPLYIMKQEIAALKLIASPELLAKLDELQNLSEDLYNDFQNCLSKISPKDANSYKHLETIGKDARWQRFTRLYEEITILMKKEIQIR